MLAQREVVPGLASELCTPLGDRFSLIEVWEMTVLGKVVDPIRDDCVVGPYVALCHISFSPILTPRSNRIAQLDDNKVLCTVIEM